MNNGCDATGVPETKARRSSKLTIVTDSELQTWRSCHQLHDFKYRQRLRPKVEAKALAVGSIFHAGMKLGLVAGWQDETRNLPTDQRVRAQITAATDGIDALVGQWAAKIVEHSSEVDYDRLADEVDETARMVKFMLSHYFTATSGDLNTLILIEAENPFVVPMRDRRGREVAHLRYTGVRDAVFYDPGYNQLVLAEHKTTGGDPRTIERRVEMDTQGAGYLNALREELAVGAFDHTTVPRDAGVGRVIYNALRKSFPKPPSVNKDGTVSVAQCTTTVAMYRDALDAQVRERGIAVSAKQQKFLDDLSSTGDKFFARVEWHRSVEDIERWRSDTFADASRIREADRDPTRRSRNPGHCNMPWSLSCAYRQICLDPDAPEVRSQFRIARDVHAEVRAAEVDAAT